MTILGFRRRPHGRHIQIGGELPNDSYNGRGWNHEAYQEAVAFHLRRIEATRTGAAIVGALTRPVLIVPRETEDGNAVTRPASNVAPGFRDTDAPGSDHFSEAAGTMAGHSRHPDLVNGPMGRTILGVIFTGTGAGTEVVIEFTPGFYVAGSPVAQASGMTGRATEVLLHELVHAVMYNRGRIDPRPMTGAAAGYHDRAEFNAIMIANIYRSELNPNAQLRGSHALASFDPLANRASFNADHAAEIADFCAKVPDIARALAGIGTASFNPIRAHLAAPVP